MDNCQIDALKVDELRLELNKRSLPKTGLKKEIIYYLNNSMEDIISITDTATTSVVPNGFQIGATWQFVDPKTESKDP